MSGLLWDFAAGRLAEEQALRVETHILVCSPCRKEAEAYLQTVGALGGLKQNRIPESRANWRDLQARLTAQPARRPLFARASWRVPSLAWGSLAVASVLGVFFFARPIDQNLGIRSSSESVVSQGISSPTTDSAVGDSSDTIGDDIADNDLESFPGTSAPVNRTTAARNHTATRRRISHSAIHWAPATNTRGEIRTARVQRRNVGKAALNYDAVDGGGTFGSAESENFVLTPVTSSSDAETPSNYVMGSVSTAVRPVSSSFDADATEAHGW